MGLSIHYSGNFNSETSLSEMIEEIKNIGDVQKWEYHIFETEFSKNNFDEINSNKNIYGICFSPPDCELVMLSFLSNGRMCNPFMLEHFLKSMEKEDEDLIYVNFTKTQFAGIESHKIIIHLLR